MADLILNIAGPLAAKRFRAVRFAATVLLIAGIALVGFGLAT